MSSTLLLFDLRKYCDNKYHKEIQSGKNKWSFSIAMNTNIEMQQDNCEIDIHIDRNNEEQILEMDKILNMTTFKCHVCDIDVPRTSVKNHIQSIKHQTCLIITKIALERANLQMKADVDYVKQDIEFKDTYFCDACAFIVQNSDKDKHERSKKHVNSNRNDILLQKLAKIYKNPMLDSEQTMNEISENNIDQIVCNLMDPIGDVIEIVRNIEANENLDANTNGKKKTNKAKFKKNNKKLKSKIDKTNELLVNHTDSIINTKEDDIRENGNEDSKIDLNNSLLNIDLNNITNKEKIVGFKIDHQKKQNYVKNEENYNDLHAINNDIKENTTEHIEKSNVPKTEHNLHKNETVNGVHNDVKQLGAIAKKNINENVAMEDTTVFPKVLKQNNGSLTSEDSEASAKKSHIVQNKLVGSFKNQDSYGEQRHYIDVVSKRFTKPFHVTALSKDVVKIVRNDGKIFRIPYLNFLGYLNIENHVVCRICAKWDLDSNHKWVEVHKRKIMAPLDEHCVRKVSNTLRHCILCNEIFMRFELAIHIKNNAHQRYLLEYLIPKTGNAQVHS